MTEMVTVPKRITHKGICQHPQTPYARRKCRAAKLAAAVIAQATATPTYQAGDEIDIDGVTIVLGSRRGSYGVRWCWVIPGIDVGSAGYKATAEDAIADARAKIAGPRCGCGEPVEMTASTRKTCGRCYDRYAA